MISHKNAGRNILKAYIMRQRNPKISAMHIAMRLNVSKVTAFRYLRVIREIKEEMTPIEEIISEPNNQKSTMDA